MVRASIEFGPDWNCAHACRSCRSARAIVRSRPLATPAADIDRLYRVGEPQFLEFAAWALGDPVPALIG
jgi:hypothetical protein